MYMKDKRSFFERLTGTVNISDDDSYEVENIRRDTRAEQFPEEREEEEEGQLTVDVYQTDNDIFIEAMVAGIRPDDISISISRDAVTIKGKRERRVHERSRDYFFNELYWGAFTRTILLPEEIIPEESEATEKHGLLTLRLPKIDKKRQLKLNVKSV